MTGNSGPILKPGEYPFEIVNAEEARSKNGNDMIELTLRIGESKVYDNLVFTDRAFWKIDQFLRSIAQHPGEGKSFDVLADDLVGHKGMCKVGMGKTAKGNERNEIDAYTWEEF
jgi:hypothetical protein